MKRLFLFFCICFSIACKKDNAFQNNEDITSVKWVLESAVLNAPLPYNNSTTTDYIAIQGPSSCLANNYTLTFSEDGTYQFSSTGALCDMVGSNKNQKWTRKDSTITLNGSSNYEQQIIIKDNSLTYRIANTPGAVYWNVLYTFKAKLK